MLYQKKSNPYVYAKVDHTINDDGGQGYPSDAMVAVYWWELRSEKLGVVGGVKPVDGQRAPFPIKKEWFEENFKEADIPDNIRTGGVKADPGDTEEVAL